MDEEHEVWDIEATVKVIFKGVQFDRPVSRDELLELLRTDSQLDIVDEEMVQVVKITKAHGYE